MREGHACGSGMLSQRVEGRNAGFATGGARPAAGPRGCGSCKQGCGSAHWRVRRDVAPPTGAAPEPGGPTVPPQAGTNVWGERT